MVKVLRNVLTSFGVSVMFLLPVLLVAQPAIAGDGISDSVCEGVGFATGDECDGAEGDVRDNVQSLIETIILYFSIIVGAISVIMIIIGGFRYITSSGDSSNVQAAKNTILYAIVGLAIVLLAQLIINFVVGQASDIEDATGGGSTPTPSG